MVSVIGDGVNDAFGGERFGTMGGRTSSVHGWTRSNGAFFGRRPRFVF